MSEKQQHEFQSEAKQVLELMVHSVYSNPDIFLRELISNASDALDKLRIESLSDDALSECARGPRIVVTVDPKERILTIRDNGIGMSREEMISYLGTIAKSGTKEFVRAMREAASAGQDGLIGQFGVGFYSSFIAAGRVTVESRRAGSGESWLWDSTGDGTFTIEPGDPEVFGGFGGNGTEITLYIKDKSEANEEDAPDKDYLSIWTLRSIIKQYSDFVSYPIYLEEAGKEKKADGADEPVNSMKAIWIRPEAEVSDEEYGEFYRHITHDWEDPLTRIVYRAEGTNEFHALLYIPSHPPFDLFHREGKHGVQLYVRRVFIMNDCLHLIPEYLRFVRGVVDSEDLPLNVSREILQEDRATAAIKRGVTRKVLEALKKMKESDAETYKKFWGMFGAVLKEGIVQDSRNREAILKLCLAENSRGETTTLEEYAARMRDGQKDIYYITGGDIETLRSSPKLEVCAKRGIEVLLLGEPIDEFWVTAAGKFGDHEFVSVASADIDLPDDGGAATDEERASAKKIEDADVAGKLKGAMTNLGGVAKFVEEVRLSTRLVDSPATFVQKGGAITPQMRAMLGAMGQEMPAEKRVLEINPAHPLVRRIADETGPDQDYADWATLLLGVAQIADGEPVDSPAAFTRTLGKLLGKC